MALSFGIAIAADVTASVKRTVHKSALKTDKVDNGEFNYSKGGNMSLIFPNDKMLMEGKTYSIVKGKRKSSASGEVAALFSVLQKVVDSVFSGKDGNIDDAEKGNVKVTRSGNVITIAPAAKKVRQKQMFTSFVITTMGNRLESIKMNGRGDNYTLFEINNYR